MKVMTLQMSQVFNGDIDKSRQLCFPNPVTVLKRVFVLWSGPQIMESKLGIMLSNPSLKWEQHDWSKFRICNRLFKV